MCDIIKLGDIMKEIIKFPDMGYYERVLSRIFGNLQKQVEKMVDVINEQDENKERK